ncbi:hypothetical protein Tsp_15500 [Trichinella spiralis]|uniref:hypothetical protein n=1 Tax=Trichinella spiralis TaxID=6334 RepID=UPI0001EFEA3C|nr:hypothetical protein Tsp_15500 [Trichinella spiralis]
MPIQSHNADWWDAWGCAFFLPNSPFQLARIVRIINICQYCIFFPAIHGTFYGWQPNCRLAKDSAVRCGVLLVRVQPAQRWHAQTTASSGGPNEVSGRLHGKQRLISIKSALECQTWQHVRPVRVHFLPRSIISASEQSVGSSFADFAATHPHVHIRRCDSPPIEYTNGLTSNIPLLAVFAGTHLPAHIICVIRRDEMDH